VSFTVHSVASPELGDGARRTASGRLKMLAVLAVCAAPVIASYFTYFVIRPEARNNYGELITPTRELPADLPLRDLAGASVKADSLRGQWLLVVVGAAGCDARCEKQLYIQRQLRETLGRDRERLDKVWLITDGAAPRAELLAAITAAAPPTLLRIPPTELGRWLAAEPGHTLAEHMYLVDPMGRWMMRIPGDPDPAKLKRDIERLLRASASWDLPGR
jgi:cytochrome oxidase Cu insertion factor (SCO1/SenC/PrrC family)